MGGVFIEALKGMRAELHALPPLERARRALLYCRILGAEMLGTIAAVPFGIRALVLHRSLPSPYPMSIVHAQDEGHKTGKGQETERAKPWAGGRQTITLARNLRYGPEERELIDIYLPPKNENGAIEADESRRLESKKEDDYERSDFSSHQHNEQPIRTMPVVLFCHGGTWVSGDRWHYSLFATRLAQAGILTCIMSYSLYPNSNISDMTEQVSRALTWTFNNIHSFGGDPQNVTLVGHSAGAQLCSLACLRRATGSHDMNTSDDNNMIGMKSDSSPRDARMPAHLVGMAGVYDLASHYEYERKREVHNLSTMARAGGGKNNLSYFSPTSIVRKSLKQIRDEKVGQLKSSNNWGFGTLFGDKIPQRSGLNLPTRQENCDIDASCPVLSIDEILRLPPTVLMHGCGDHVVPWYESAEYHNLLSECEIPSRLLLYDRWVGHGEFITSVKPLPQATQLASHETGNSLPDYTKDLISIARNEY